MKFISVIASLALGIGSAHGQSTIAYFRHSPGVGIRLYHPIGIDFDGDGTPEFSFSASGVLMTTDVPPSNYYLPIMVNAAGRNSLLESGYALVQPAGVLIDSEAPAGSAWHGASVSLTGNWWSLYGQIINGEVVHWGWNGSLGEITDGYLGVRFYLQDHLHYGWIRIRLLNSGAFSGSGQSYQDISPVILEWAFETRPDTPILAGVIPISTPVLPPYVVEEPKSVVFPDIAGLAGAYQALVKPAAGSSPGNLGLIQARVTQGGAFSGSVSVGGVRLPVSGILAPDGSARFRPAMTPELELVDGRGPARRSLGFLSMAFGNRSGLSGELRGAGDTVLASFAGLRAPLGRRNSVPAELLNLPVSGGPTRGYYNVAFAPRETDGSKSPVGYGFGGLTLKRTGLAVVRGYLADGSRFTGSALLRADRSLACFRRLYGNQGAIGGELAFDPDSADSDLTGADWLWVRPVLPRARAYQDGWPEGVRVDALGTKYAFPASVDFGQGTGDGAVGNVSLQFREGRLSGSRTFAASVDPLTGYVVGVPATTRGYSLRLNKRIGYFGGRFLHEDGTRPLYRGILLNKGANRGGFGFFRSAGPGGQSGAVTLDPDGP